MPNSFTNLNVPSSNGVGTATDLGTGVQAATVLLSFASTPPEGNGTYTFEASFNGTNYAPVLLFADQIQGVRAFQPPEDGGLALVRYVRVRLSGRTASSPVNPYAGISAAATPNVEVDTDNIVDGAVSTPKIEDLAVTAAKIDADAVTTVKIQNNAVTTAKIADANVTTAKVAGDAITGVTAAPPAATIPLIRTINSVAGRNGAGACTATGAKVGDKVLAVTLAKVPTAAAATVVGRAAFEATITVADQIQQSSTADLSAEAFDLQLLARS